MTTKNIWLLVGAMHLVACGDDGANGDGTSRDGTNQTGDDDTGSGSGNDAGSELDEGEGNPTESDTCKGVAEGKLLLESATASRILVDGDLVYILDYAYGPELPVDKAGAIRVLSPGGGEPTVLFEPPAGQAVKDIWVDGEFIYLMMGTVGEVYQRDPSFFVQRIPKAGGVAEKISLDPFGKFVEIFATNQDAVFLADNNHLWRVAKAGGKSVLLLEYGKGIENPQLYDGKVWYAKKVPGESLLVPSEIHNFPSNAASAAADTVYSTENCPDSLSVTPGGVWCNSNKRFDDSGKLVSRGLSITETAAITLPVGDTVFFYGADYYGRVDAFNVKTSEQKTIACARGLVLDVAANDSHVVWTEYRGELFEDEPNIYYAPR